MKTLIILSLCALFYWLYCKHKKNKEHDRKQQKEKDIEEEKKEIENFENNQVTHQYTTYQKVDYQPNTIYISAFLSPIFEPKKSQ